MPAIRLLNIGEGILPPPASPALIRAIRGVRAPGIRPPPVPASLPLVLGRGARIGGISTMNDRVITDGGQMDVVWLSRALTRSGALTSGSVTAFTAEPQDNACSRSARIRPRYASGSTGHLPPRLFLKMC